MPIFDKTDFYDHLKWNIAHKNNKAEHNFKVMLCFAISVLIETFYKKSITFQNLQ